MIQLSANLGFLWNHLTLPDAIYAARAAGFDAVECHWPYDQDQAAVRRALDDTGLAMLGLNTPVGDKAGDKTGDSFGLGAIADQHAAAQRGIELALAWAVALDTPNIHLMAGKADGQPQAVQSAGKTFDDNIAYACKAAAAMGKTILIEPINTLDVPGYFLSTTAQAIEIVQRLALPNLKIMFDCYHVARMGHDVLEQFRQAQPHIGHVQFASAPNRAEPNAETLRLLRAIAAMGWTQPMGAEYRTAHATVEAGLGWMKELHHV